jgi:hypothetical protein
MKEESSFSKFLREFPDKNHIKTLPKADKSFNLSEKLFFYKQCPKSGAHFYFKDVKEFIRRCFNRMEKRLVGNKIKYQDVVLIIKEEAGEKLTK